MNRILRCVADGTKFCDDDRVRVKVPTEVTGLIRNPDVEYHPWMDLIVTNSCGDRVKVRREGAGEEFSRWLPAWALEKAVPK